MTIFKTLQDLFKRKSSGVDSYSENIFDSSTTSLPLYSCSQYYELSKLISSIAKSVSEICNTSIAQNYELYNLRTDQPIEKYSDEISDFLEQPSITNNYDELTKLFLRDLLLAGECFAYFVQIEGQTRIYIQRLDPCGISVEGTTIEHEYYYDTNSRRQLLDKDHLVHLKLNPSINNELRGEGVIEGNLELFKHTRDTVFLRSDVIAKGAFITGVFSRDDEGGGMIEDSRTEKIMRAKYTGPKNVGPVFLPSKLKYHDIVSGLSKLGLDEKLDGLDRKIKAAFGLPRFLAEDGAVQGQKYNNHEKQLQHYLSNVIAPLLGRMEIIFSAGISRIISGFGLRYVLPKEIFSREEVLKMVASGMLTPNEGLKLQGLPKSKDERLNEHIFANNLLTADQLFSPSVPEPKAETPNPTPEKKVSCGQARIKSWRDTHDGGWISNPHDGIWTYSEIKMGQNSRAINKDLERLSKASIEKKSKEQSKDFGKFLGETYLGILQALQKNNLVWEAEAKNNREKTASSWESKLFDVATSNAALIPVLDNAHLAVGAAAYSNIGAALTTEIPFGSISRPEVAAKINLLRKTGPLINQTTKDKLTVVLKESMQSGLSVPETAQAIMRRFGDDTYKMSEGFRKIFKPGFPTHGADWDRLMQEVLKTTKLQNRALLIARTESGRAYTEFSKQALIESGVVKGAQIVGCSQTGENNSNTDCVPVDKIDGLELKHICCSGVLIPCF